MANPSWKGVHETQSTKYQIFSTTTKSESCSHFANSGRQLHFTQNFKKSKSTVARLGRLSGRVLLRCGVVSSFLSRCCTLQCRENLTLTRSLIQKPPQVKNLLPKFAKLHKLLRTKKVKVENNHSKTYILLQKGEVS